MTKHIQRIGVVGAGQMGRGIAQVAAQAGIHVVLIDTNLDLVRQAFTRIDSDLLKLVEKGKLSGSEHEAAAARLEAADAPAALAGCDFIIEAAPESEALKREIFAASAPHAKAHPGHQHLVDLDHQAGGRDPAPDRSSSACTS